jgi:hypothetical protein
MKKHIILFSIGASISLYCISQSSPNMTIQSTNRLDTTIIDSAIYPLDTLLPKSDYTPPKNKTLTEEREKRKKARAKYQRDKQIQP